MDLMCGTHAGQALASAAHTAQALQPAPLPILRLNLCRNAVQHQGPRYVRNTGSIKTQLKEFSSSLWK